MLSGERPNGLIIFTLYALITPPQDDTLRAYHCWQILPGREWKLRLLHKAGWVIGVVSNQDAVALGHVSDGDYWHKTLRLRDLLGVVLDYRVCYAHPDAPGPEFHDENALGRRLPGSAMLIELMLAHPAEMQRGTLFVGASGGDRDAALDAGIDFMPGDEVFTV